MPAQRTTAEFFARAFLQAADANAPMDNFGPRAPRADQRLAPMSIEDPPGKSAMRVAFGRVRAWVRRPNVLRRAR
jgi:hypothetical protein